jgi:DNA polymerase-3 subunit beta
VHIRIPAGELERVLDIGKKILKGKSAAFDVTSALLFEATGSDYVVVKATDLKHFVKMQVPADVLEPGSFGISLNHLRTVLQDTGVNMVEIEEVPISDEGELGLRTNIRIRAGAVEIEVPPLSEDVFPAFPEMPSGAWSAILPTSFLREVADRIRAFADKKGSSLSVIHFELEDEGSTAAVATDGYRLGVYREETPQWNGGREFTMRVEPFDVLGVVMKEWPTESEVEALISESRQSFTVGPVTVITDVPTGRFPGWRKVFPREAEVVYTVFREDLVSALKGAVAFMGADVSLGVDLISDGVSLTVYVEMPEGGRYRKSMTLTGIDGDPVSLPFNPKFLLDALKAMEGYEEVMISLKDKYTPAVISPKSDPERVQVLVMPVKR